MNITMPPAKKGAKKRPYKKRKAGIPRSVNPRYQVATVVETLDPGVSFLENAAAFQNIQLQSFKRCIAMSNLYEQYRIEEVKFTYSPLYNTFQEASTAAPSVPIFYHCMDRLQSLNPSTTTLSDLVQMGAQRRVFQKPVTVKYRPNTMISTGVSGTVTPGFPGVEVFQINGADYGRWFPCVTQNITQPGQNTPNTLSSHIQQYNGHWTYFEQQNAIAVTPCATVAITIRVSFKNPLVNETPTAPVPVAWSPKMGPAETREYRTFGGTVPESS
jgi:hypothetical protein